MENTNIWLIDHKATLGKFSPLNMDGSEWIKGICIVAAVDESTALHGFRKFLAENQMEDIDVYEIKPYREEDYLNHENAKHIAHGVRIVADRGETAYIGTQTSESFADSESEASDE